jgi:chorismate synthase
MNSSIGTTFRVTLFGGSHEDAIGAVISGLPAGFVPDYDELQRFMDRRAPGKSPFATPRKEDDRVEIASEDPLTLIIRNRDTRPGDYARQADIPRPGHADAMAFLRYGDALNMSGGGPFSGRMTATLCMAGGLALQVLAKQGIRIGAHIAAIGEIRDMPFESADIPAGLLAGLGTSDFPVLSPDTAPKMQEQILKAKADGDSIGGVVEAAAIGLPSGVGGPLFDGVESKLAPLLLAIPGVKGLEFGAGFQAATLRGSENNDPFLFAEGRLRTRTNHHGGILGGMTSGMPLVLRLAFKPTPSIAKPQESVNLKTGEAATLVIQGRHDPCIVPRAVPVVEAALAIGLLDLLLTDEAEGGAGR